MLYQIQFALIASDQIDSLEAYISATAGAVTDRRYVDGIIDFCSGFSTFPHRGYQRDDLAHGLRVTNFRRRVIIAFTVDDERKVVIIMGVYYGGQNFEADLVDDR